MPCCAHCQDAENFFTERTARRDLRRYRRKGPAPATRLLLRQLAHEPLDGAVLLDIGGGIGAIQHELMTAGLSRAIHVDASNAYLRASQAEAARRGHRHRTEYHFGDYAELADALPDADLVTLDRVVCCYPDMPRLVAASARRARRLLALSYPRPHPIMRCALAVVNLWRRLRGSRFRTYLHHPEAIDAEIRRCGFRPTARARTFLWEIALYRAKPPADAKNAA